MESRSKSKSKLKQLTRFFQPSKLLNNSCNTTSSSSTIFTSSSSPNTGSTRSSEAALYVASNAKTYSNNNKLDRALSFNSSSSFRNLSFDLTNICKPTKKSQNNDVVTNVEPNHERSTFTPLKEFFEEEKIDIKKKKKKAVFKNAYGFSSSFEESEFFSSNEVIDKEDETEAFFSSRSFDSFESCEFYKKPLRNNDKNKKRSKKKKISFSRRRVYKGIEGIPVIVRSSDPYLDFKDSMLEMIVERQIFGDEDLEKLIYSYLSLNSPLHHRQILRAFHDVCQALFGC